MLQPSLEQLPVKEPDLQRFISEIQQGAVDANSYLERIEHGRHWWHCLWPGQTYDGRRHAQGESDVVLPWEGASDSRLRIVGTIVDQHVTLAKTAFWNARIQCRSVRPLVYGRKDNIAQKELEWRIYTQMRAELLRELPLAFSWRYAIGLAFISVEWEQQRVKGFEPITMETMAELSQKLDAPELLDMGGGEESDNLIIDVLQSLSEIMSREDARKVLSDLRNTGMAQMPVVNVVVNKPRWQAKLPCIDILFPSETANIQSERWIDQRELITESELTDRIETDGYDEDFVEEACKHKGEFSDFLTNPKWRYTSTGSERDLIELHHFLYKSVEDGIPCIYRTVFNEACAGKKLFAVHRPFEYKHQQYPLVALRRTHHHRPLLTSRGIAEEAYTDEQDIKVQQDGLTNRTDLIHQPPMVVPTLRAQGVKSSYGPRAIMASLRPGDVNFPPLPPSDSTPMEVVQMVEMRLRDRYWCLDPTMNAMRVRELAQDILGEMELVVEQTLQLDQQFATDEEVQRVAGSSGVPWNVSTKDIQGKYEITVSYDPKLSDMAYVKELMQMYQQAMSFNTAGGAKMDKMFSRILGIIDPDAEDLIEENQQSVTDKETDEEDQAAAAILSGIEPRFPIQGNHQLRMQRLVSQTIQSKNPEVQQKIASSKGVQELLKNRLKNFQNQIQQHILNPQIGRSVTTSAQSPQQPAQLMQ